MTAAQAVLQRRVTISASRGAPENREAEAHRFVDDLRRAARIAHHAARAREEETTR